jgi:hypothetical protein
MNNEDTQVAGLSLADGEVIETTGPSEVNQSYCAFVGAIDVGAAGVVRLEVGDYFLLSVNVDTFDPANHLVLEIDSQGLVAIDYATVSEVRALGLEPVELAASTAATPTQTGTGITRTPRTSSTEPTPTETSTGITRTPRTGSAEPRSTETSTGITRTPRTGATQPTADSGTNPPDADVALQDTRDRLRGRSQGGIVAGEWELEEPPMQNLLFVTITEERNAYGPYTVQALDGEELEDITGFPLLSEDPAPVGCRAFTLQGPYQTVLFVGMCAYEDYLLAVMGTDENMVTAIMNDFVDGKPFIIPPGYEVAPELRRLGVRWVA